MLAADRFVLSGDLPLIGSDGRITASRILECKTANPFAQSEWGGEAGSDQVPLSYLVQCVWYMMLTNIDRTDLAVLFGNADFRIYEISRDLELEQMVLERAKSFWENHVLTDIPPQATSESDYKTLFGKSTVSKSVEAPAETCELIKKLKSLSEQVEHYESEISHIKQSIMGQMQDAEVLTFHGQTLATWKAPKPSLRLDAKRLSKEHPDLVDQYQSTCPEQSSFGNQGALMKALSTAISNLCQTMALDPDEVQLWLNQHLGVPLYPQVQLLRLANKYQLDPLSDEIALLQGQDQTYQPFITIDGWSKLINNHPQYAGMSLRDSTELVEGIPTWMECTIYRNDRILPIVIKEYFEEVRTDHPSWQQMPRRMLRHRAIQQCARLTFGISQHDASSFITDISKNKQIKRENTKLACKNLGPDNLKKLLNQ